MISSFLGHIDNVRILFKIERNLRDVDGRSAIMHACAGRKVEIVLALWGASKNDVDG